MPYICIHRCTVITTVDKQQARLYAPKKIIILIILSFHFQELYLKEAHCFLMETIQQAGHTSGQLLVSSKKPGKLDAIHPSITKRKLLVERYQLPTSPQ